MRISLRWLAELVSPLPEVDELADVLTHAGLEVEGIERLGLGLDSIVVGEVLAKEPMEGSAKLHLCTVEVGADEPLSIVCGADNYEVGDKVPTAMVGAVLPGGLRIEARDLRGVPSHGMLCSEVELGLSDEGEGLMILEREAQVGRPIVEHLHLDDVVFTLNATPNRPDWLSHFGVAREIAAVTGASLRRPQPEVREGAAQATALASVRIDAADRCGRYAARVVEGVAFGPSPRWMQARLTACGMRPLGNLIDVTNYVLLEAGHPLHAFDLDRVAGASIEVRLAKEGEKLTTLDGKERALSQDDLVIADREKALVLAGVMGGEDAEVGEGTTRVLLESAHFDPSGVRRSSKRHGLHTESSHRFERGADPEAVRWALSRTAQLLVELAGGEVAAGVLDVYPGRQEPKRVRLRFSRVGALLGLEVPRERCREILASLGFGEEDATEEAATFTVPTFRVDVDREVDLIEEIARIVGYDQIPEALPTHPGAPPRVDRSAEVLALASQALAAHGLDEAVHLAFADPVEDPAMLRSDAPLISLQNPLASHWSRMRSSLVPNLLRAVRLNRSRGNEDVRLWEQGKVFFPHVASNQPVRESRRLGGVVVGRRLPLAWSHEEVAVDFYDVKGALESVLDGLGLAGVEWVPGDAPFLHPRSACTLRVGEVEVGLVGELHPMVADEQELPRGVFVFELSLDELDRLANFTPSYRGIPRFPATLRDLAVVVPSEVSVASVEAILSGPAGRGLVEGVDLFDVYEGPQVEEGKKSLAFAIRYRAADRTLTDKEVGPVHDALVAALAAAVGAELRG